MIKLRYIFFLFTLFCVSNTTYAYVVLLDPGHGGSELGAVSTQWLKNSKGKRYKKTIYEKDLCLILAKKIKKRLEKKHTTYLTRSFDRLVTLQERADIAETVKADIFVSIHFNSSTNKKAHGIETFYLDNHDDVAIRKVEDIENAALTGADKVINQILIDLVIQKTVPSSKKLANSVHGEISKNISKKYKIKDRGIKPGLFYVLALSKRPGILLEVGFMSNISELNKVRSTRYLNDYAKSVADGISNYLATLPKKELPLF